MVVAASGQDVLALILAEWFTQYDQPNEIAKAAIFRMEFGKYLVRGRAVTNLQLSSKCIGEHFLSKATFELLFSIKDQFAEFWNG